MSEETDLEIWGIQIRTLKGLPKGIVLLALKSALGVDITATDEGILVEFRFNPEKIAVIKMVT